MGKKFHEKVVRTGAVVRAMAKAKEEVFQDQLRLQCRKTAAAEAVATPKSAREENALRQTAEEMFQEAMKAVEVFLYFLYWITPRASGDRRFRERREGY